MTKTIKNLFVIILLLSLGFILTSCGGQGPKANLDLEKAAENLEDEDYFVTFEDDEDELGAGVVQMLNARNDDDFLYVTEYEDSKSAQIAFDIRKQNYNAQVEQLKLEIQVYEHQLKKYEDDLDSDDIDDLEDEIKEITKKLEELEEDYCFGISGKFVWYGTIDAIEDSK